MNEIRYVRNDLQVSYVGLGQCLIRPALGGPDFLAPAPLAEVTRFASGIKTLIEHARDVMRQVPSRPAPTIAQELAARLQAYVQHSLWAQRVPDRLQTCVEHRLLIPEDELISALSVSPPHTDHSPPAIQTLAVMTCDRSRMLLRCLDSYAENVAQFGRSVRILVMDDSRREKEVEANSASIATVGRRWGVPIEHFSMTNARALALRLVKRGLRPEVVDFAIIGATAATRRIGASRNRLLLRTAGQRIVSVDDDTVCDIRAPEPQAGCGLEAHGFGDFWFFCRPADRAGRVNAGTANANVVFRL